jgi:hypothetical protein
VPADTLYHGYLLYIPVVVKPLLTLHGTPNLTLTEICE